jgi:hypothetical protein
MTRGKGMESAKQRRIVDIDRGLFLVRYASADDEVRPPTVRVSSEPASDKNVSLVLHPDQKEAVLWHPGSCLVVRTVSKGKLSIEVRPAQEGASVAATVRMEKLTQGEPPFSQAQTSDTASSFDLSDLRLLGHVASIGDVIVRGNEWLAGPSAPSRIEGISIQWSGKPDDVDICYSVNTARPQTVSGRMIALGSFAGTRGKAMPVVGLTFEVSGAGAPYLQFSAEAIFLGAPATRITGRRIVLSGPTGREPLVGLRLSLEEVDAMTRSQPTTPATRPGRASSGVRVFRSRPKQDQSAAL